LIPFDFITEWRAFAPWMSDVQVEQDLIITRAVVEMFNVETVASALAFRGGTALYKLHLASAVRYSEDIDLVQVTPGPIGPSLNSLRATLDPWLGTPKHSRSEGRVTLVYRMKSEGPGSPTMRMKVEINSREHFSVLGFEERALSVTSRWFSGSTMVRTYALDELLGTKLRALYQRKKCRDLFDLWWANTSARVDPDRVVQCFLRYLEHGGTRISRAELEANLIDKLADPAFARDLEPLLSPGVQWSVEAAGRYVLDELAARLPGQAWKGAGARR
jgi:predicted nucleotidyltransferase component of viral defense system